MSRKKQLTSRKQVLMDMLSRGWTLRNMAARFGLIPRNFRSMMTAEGLGHIDLSDKAADARYEKTGIKKNAMIEPSAEVIKRLFRLRLEGKQDTSIGKLHRVTRDTVRRSDAFMPEIAILKDMLREQNLAKRKAMKRLHQLGLTVQRVADLFDVTWDQAAHHIFSEKYAHYAKSFHKKRKAQGEVHRKDAKEEAETVRNLRAALRNNPLLREAWEEITG